jgi:hypothetical protein
LSQGPFSIILEDKGKTRRYVITDGTQFLCYAEIMKNDKWPNRNIWFFKRVERDKNLGTKGIPAAFFHYLIINQNIELLSDITMSTEGNRFWRI